MFCFVFFFPLVSKADCCHKLREVLMNLWLFTYNFLVSVHFLRITVLLGLVIAWSDQAVCVDPHSHCILALKVLTLR